MKPSLDGKLICPVDNHELELRMYSRGSSYHLAEGVYSCTCCKRYYNVVNGKPLINTDSLKQKAPPVVIPNWVSMCEPSFA